MATVRKKQQRFTIPVSKTNAKRAETGTHTLDKILKLEGHVVKDGVLYMSDREIPLGAVDLHPKAKRTEVIKVAKVAADTTKVVANAS
jgi:hypothetical protein